MLSSEYFLSFDFFVSLGLVWLTDSSEAKGQIIRALAIAVYVDGCDKKASDKKIFCGAAK